MELDGWLNIEKLVSCFSFPKMATIEISTTNLSELIFKCTPSDGPVTALTVVNNYSIILESYNESQQKSVKIYLKTIYDILTSMPLDNRETFLHDLFDALLDTRCFYDHFKQLENIVLFVGGSVANRGCRARGSMYVRV